MSINVWIHLLTNVSWEHYISPFPTQGVQSVPNNLISVSMLYLRNLYQMVTIRISQLAQLFHWISWSMTARFAAPKSKKEKKKSLTTLSLKIQSGLFFLRLFNRACFCFCLFFYQLHGPLAMLGGQAWGMTAVPSWPWKTMFVKWTQMEGFSGYFNIFSFIFLLTICAWLVWNAV